MNEYKRFIGSKAEFPSRTWGSLKVESAEFTDAIDGDLIVSIGDSASQEIPLVRIHSECVFAEVFDSALCDCSDQLHMALATIRQEGHGTMFYLRMDGRGAGLAAKVCATALEMAGEDTYDSRVKIGVPTDGRSFESIGKYLLGIGVTKIRLLTNNPAKVADLEKVGIEVVPTPLKVDNPDKRIEHLYATKAAKFGHAL